MVMFLLRLIPLILGLILLFFIFKSFFDEVRFKLEEEINKRKAKRIGHKEVVEPHSKILRKNHSIVVWVKIPEVSLRDVDIKRLENSLEVRAKKGDKVYFKLFAIPKEYRIVEKRLENEELVIMLEK